MQGIVFLVILFGATMLFAGCNSPELLPTPTPVAILATPVPTNTPTIEPARKPDAAVTSADVSPTLLNTRTLTPTSTNIATNTPTATPTATNTSTVTPTPTATIGASESVTSLYPNRFFVVFCPHIPFHSFFLGDLLGCARL